MRRGHGANLLLILLVLEAGCSGGSRAEAVGAPEATPVVGVELPETGPLLWYGRRPACPPGLRDVMDEGDIATACRVGGVAPVRFAGPTWCAWEYPHGTVVVFEAPSFAALRRAFVEAAPVAAGPRWGFLWPGGGGTESFVLQGPADQALVVQVPRRLCSRSGLVALGRRVAQRRWR